MAAFWRDVWCRLCGYFVRGVSVACLMDVHTLCSNSYASNPRGLASETHRELA